MSEWVAVANYVVDANGLSVAVARASQEPRRGVVYVGADGRVHF